MGLRKAWFLAMAGLAAAAGAASCVGDDPTTGGGPGNDAGPGTDSNIGNDGGGGGDASTDTGADVDTLGPPPAATGDVQWIRDLEDLLTGTTAVVDSNNEVIAIGQISVPVMVNGQTYTPASGRNEAFLARFDNTGAIKAFALITTTTPNPNFVTGNVFAQGLAVGEDGEIYVSGYTSGSALKTSTGTNTTFNNPAAVDGGAGANAGFVLRARPTDFSSAWATAIRPLGSTGGSTFAFGCPAVAVRVLDVAGQKVPRVTAGCNVTGTVTIDPMNPQTASTYNGFGGVDVGVFTFDFSSGKVIWANLIGGTLIDRVDSQSIAVAPNGDVRVGIKYTSPLIKSTRNDLTEDNMTIGVQGLVVSLGGDGGQKLWSHVFRAASNPSNNEVPIERLRLGVDEKNATIVGGIFTLADVNFGKSNQSPGGVGGSLFLVKLDATGSDVQESFLPLTTNIRQLSFAVDRWGSTVAAVQFGNTLSIPGFPVATAPVKSEDTPLLVKFDPTGKPVWVKTFDTSFNGDDVVSATASVGVGPSGTVGVAGTLNGTWTVGGKSINPTAGSAVDAGRGADNSNYYGYAMRVSP